MISLLCEVMGNSDSFIDCYFYGNVMDVDIL